jgi:hypothetical protein
MTPAQINEANAQHSTGPKIKAGKQRSRLNALRHGLTGQIIVLPNDDLNSYQQHIQNFVSQYHPKGATELALLRDGFVFSDKEIEAFIARDHRDKRALRAKGYCFSDGA